jgi:hypothetical protein
LLLIFVIPFVFVSFFDICFSFFFFFLPGTTDEVTEVHDPLTVHPDSFSLSHCTISERLSFLF